MRLSPKNTDQSANAPADFVRFARAWMDFNLLRALGDEMHRDLGVNASMLAVLECLTGGQAKTVPDIARSRG